MRTGPPVSTYRVDDALPTTFSPTLDADTHYQVTFFTSPALQDGAHTLFMTCIVNNTYLWFDYLLVQLSIPSEPARIVPDPSTEPSTESITKTVIQISSALNSATPASPPFPSSRMSLQTPGFSVTIQTSDSRTVVASSTNQISTTTQLSTVASGNIPVPIPTPARPFPTGAVVGGVVGGVAAIAILVLFILLRWRRQRAAWANSGSCPQPFTSFERRMGTTSNNEPWSQGWTFLQCYTQRQKH
ncbi:hypothetical protein HGRIS_006846 [Hohenbuehelia grisea]|uniref:Uncharacterized protein n=1 Tax=Hohenbuehelia grisea TaxID=104357 RepID=A0ABR3JA72_9AGAR